MRLLHRPSGLGMIVGLPAPPPGPAIHICRYMVEEPRPARSVVHVPRPSADPSSPGALAAEALFLPERLLIDSRLLVPRGLESGMARLWDTMSEPPLTVPVAFSERHKFDLGWRVKTVVTPGECGSPFSPEDHAEVGWSVLARANMSETVGLIAYLACLVECRRRDAGLYELLVRATAPPQPYGSRLMAAARGAEPVFDPKALRWIIAELAAAQPEILMERAGWTAAGTTGADLLAAAWFPWLRVASGQPSGRDVLLAVWLIQEAFHGADGAFTDYQNILGGITAIGYATDPEGGWLPKLDRWSHIWAVPDSHPAVQKASHAPSKLRSLFTTALGISPSEWLAGTWLICMRWWFQLLRTARARMTPVDLYTSTLGNERVQLSDAFVAAFEKNMVTDLADLGAEVRRSFPSYGGLGTVSQIDPVALRNRPVIRLADGTLVPTSLELVADRAAVLWRFLLSSSLRGARSGIAALGHQYEAYVTDFLTDRIGPSHRVLTEAEVTAVLGGATRCDQVVIHGGEWLFVENSLITLNRGIAGGETVAIEQVCRRYHEEADQAEATAAESDALADAYGLARPRSKAILVVTDNPVMHTPVLMERLWQQRPDRNPRFVCSTRELEGLTELSRVGWSLPGAVMNWQRQEVEGPLQSAIHDLSRIASRPMEPPTSASQWVDRLPRSSATAA